MARAATAALLATVASLACGEANLTPPATCFDQARNDRETDVDCGGSCAPCGDFKQCASATDCSSRVCSQNRCAPAGCSDGVRNGDESDADCGGSLCAKCDNTRECMSATDCLSGLCMTGRCAAPPCLNMTQDGDETDVDCGGANCPACKDKMRCTVGSDCLSGTCHKNRCVTALMCALGTADCNFDDADGCEVKINTDPTNCGQCGAQCGPGTPFCRNGKCTTPVSVLLAFSGDASEGPDVQKKLMATGSFAAVDLFNVGKLVGKPLDLQTMKKYQAILVWITSGLLDRVSLGDNLADYFDGGGRVVVALQYSDGPSFYLGGRFGDVANGYLVMEPGRFARGGDTLGMINEKGSILLNGVTMLTTATSCRSDSKPANGGAVVASWSGGAPLIIRGNVKGRARVDLNLCPPSADAVFGSWVGDGAQILRNALLY